MNWLPGNFTQTLTDFAEVLRLVTEILKLKLHQVPLKILIECSGFLLPTFKPNEASFYYLFELSVQRLRYEL